MRHSLPIILALAALAGPSRATAQRDERHDVNLRNDCRLAAQILTTGEPHPHRDWALETLGRCNQSGGVAIAGLWTAPPADTAGLERLYWLTAGFLDARPLAAARQAAGNTANATLLRLTGLRVLAAYLNPQVEPGLGSLTPPPEDPACEPLANARSCVWSRVEMVGSLSHRVVTLGDQPPPSGYQESILSFLSDLAAADPDRTVRYAAMRLHQRLAP